MATIPLTIATRRGGAQQAVLDSSRYLVTLSERARELHIRSGADPAKLVSVPNFVPGVGRSEAEEDSPWLYIGRLTPEKGIVEALKNWPRGEKLLIAGSGPSESAVREFSSNEVQVLGPVPRDEVSRLLTQCRGLLFPSRWAEGAVPLTYLEAISAGKPVVAFAGSAAADDIDEAGTGVVFGSFETLGQAISLVTSDWRRYADAARDRFDSEYSAVQWLDRMEDLYDRSVN